MSETRQDYHELKTEAINEASINSVSYLGRNAVSLYLTAKGKKPASILEIILMPQDDDSEVGECYSLLEEMGLPYEYTIHEDEDEPFKRHVFYVGKDEKHLQNLLQAKANHSTNGSREMGKALGYPETAIGLQEKLRPEDYPEELCNDPDVPFCLFTLSQTHWQEEMHDVRLQAAYIKQTNKALYDVIVKESQSSSGLADLD